MANYYRDKIVSIMKSWLGRNEHDKTHREIIDLYNTIPNLPRAYKVKYTDNWCATTCSAAFHKAGYNAIFPSECSCGKMIEKAKKMGCWTEKDSYVPKPGDCIIYDWDDDGKGDDKAWPEHIGVVEKVTGKTITVIEGNYSESVKRREIKVNGRYIRGFVTPKFTADKKPENKVSGTYKVITANSLYVRSKAGTKNPAVGVIHKGNKVTVSDSKKVDNTTWYKLTATINSRKIIGWSSGKFLKKV